MLGSLNKVREEVYWIGIDENIDDVWVSFYPNADKGLQPLLAEPNILELEAFDWKMGLTSFF